MAALSAYSAPDLIDRLEAIFGSGMGVFASPSVTIRV